MVMCVVVGCSKRSGRDRDVSFFRIPNVVSGKGPQNLLELSKKHRAGYLAAISRIGVTDKILNNDRICSKHFISGKPADLEDETNPDWLPTLNLGYQKHTDSQGKTERWSRRRARETAKEEERDNCVELKEILSPPKDQDSDSISNLKDCRANFKLGKSRYNHNSY